MRALLHSEPHGSREAYMTACASKEVAFDYPHERQWRGNAFGADRQILPAPGG
jgi:hypothetical protein